MPRRNIIAGTGTAAAGFAGCLLVLAVIFLAVFLGPMCLAYDVNVWGPVLAHRPVHVEWFTLPIIIGGILLSEIAVPVAIVTWVLVTAGLVG